MKSLPPIKEGLLSDDLLNKLMAMAFNYSGISATPWQHLADAVSRGTVSPMEAYDALTLGYVPEYLTVRESSYSHLL